MARERGIPRRARRVRPLTQAIVVWRRLFSLYGKSFADPWVWGAAGVYALSTFVILQIDPNLFRRSVLWVFAAFVVFVGWRMWRGRNSPM